MRRTGRFMQRLIVLNYFQLQEPIARLKNKKREKERLVCDPSHSRGAGCSCWGTDGVRGFSLLSLTKAQSANQAHLF